MTAASTTEDDGLPNHWRSLGWLFPLLAGMVIAFHVGRACVDVPFWDDFDAYLLFLLRIDDASGFGEQLRIATEFHNEHRTLMSRAAVWLTHSLGEPMNFRILAWVGAAMFIPTVLLAGGRAGSKNARAAAVFFSAAMLFNLQNWENYFWGGSSIDHVTVVPLSMTALLLLHFRSRWAMAGAILFGFFAAFTLAQGLLVFPAGVVALLLQRRWAALGVWLLASAGLAACWMFGFPDTNHAYSQPGFEEVVLIARFSLGLIGAPLAFGSRAVAPWIGGVIVLTLVALIVTGAWRREHYQVTLVVFLAAALLAISFGRTAMDPHGFMVSRYRVLSCLLIAVGAMLLFMRTFSWRRFGLATRVILVVGVLGHWLEQTIDHWWRSSEFRESRMAAVRHYEETGTLAGSPTELYYDVPKADSIIERSAARGIYRLSRLPRRQPPPPEISPEETPQSPP